MIRFQLDITPGAVYLSEFEAMWITNEQTIRLADEVADRLRAQGLHCVREEDEAEAGAMYQQVRLTGPEGAALPDRGYFQSCLLDGMAFLSVESWSEDDGYEVELARSAALIRAVEDASGWTHLDTAIPELEALLTR